MFDTAEPVTLRARNSLAQDDLRCAFPRFEQETLTRNLRLLERVEAIAAAQDGWRAPP